MRSYARLIKKVKDYVWLVFKMLGYYFPIFLGLRVRLLYPVICLLSIYIDHGHRAEAIYETDLTLQFVHIALSILREQPCLRNLQANRIGMPIFYRGFYLGVYRAFGSEPMA